MKIVSVVGARPQFVKLAPVAVALALAGHEHVIVHTGQHYDYLLSEAFFEGLDIPQPNVQLDIGSGKHGKQTADMTAGLEPVLEQQCCDIVLSYGDTNTTLAASIVVGKMQLPLAHLEAGLRSYNRRMPEEMNRIVADHTSDLLLAPTSVAMSNLQREGLGSRAVLVGDVMTDVCYDVRDRVEASGTVGLPGRKRGSYLLATIHRAENTDEPGRLMSIMESLGRLARPVVVPAHPRLLDACRTWGIDLGSLGLTVCDPLPYDRMVSAIMGAAGVITDSGGLQKECFLLGTVCTTVRTETEWPETLIDGWNSMAPDPSSLHEASARLRPTQNRGEPYGDGAASGRVATAIERYVSGRRV